MNTEKKILFLLLALFILIITCVFTHVDDFKTNENAPVSTSVESDSPSIITSVMEKAKSFISPIEEDISQDETLDIKKIEEPLPLDKTSDNETIQNEITDNSKISEESLLDTENKDETNIEEPSVEPIVPLITTDKRYNRIDDEKNIEDLSNEAQLLQIKMNELVKKSPIIFKRGSNKITKSSNRSIKSIVESLKEFPTMKIEVAGHTDAIGAAKFNKIISEQRAISVKKRLVYYGIESNRIKARGYGEDIPLVKNSANGYSKINRRVEFNIVEE